MKDEIVKAFHYARQRFSPERVIADPNLNRACLGECNRLGLGSDAAPLNRSRLSAQFPGGSADSRSSTVFPGFNSLPFSPG